MTTYGLVLSGGGARGAFEAGVVKALHDAGIVPSIVAGTSAGAINGTAVAIGMAADDLVDIWATLTSEDVYRVRRDLWNAFSPRELLRHPRRLLPRRGHSPVSHAMEAVGWTWFLDPSPLRELLVRLIGGERLPIADDVRFTVVSVELGTGELARFTNASPPLHDARYREVELTVDHVMSSAAIPVLFQPTGLDGGLYWDGGIASNTPLGAALGHRPDVCFVVATGAVDRSAGAPGSLSEAVSLLVDDLLRISLLRDLEHAMRVNELIDVIGEDYGGGRYKKVEFHLIAPPSGGAGVSDFLDFEPARARQLIAQGVAAGRAAVAAHHRQRDA